MSKYLEIAKELFIVAAVAAVLWFVWNARGNKDDIKQLRSDVQIVQQNAAQQARWQKGVTDALEQANSQYKTLGDAVRNNKPIIVRVPAPGPVPAAANAGPQGPAVGGGVSEGQQPAVQLIDIRPMWNAYLAKYGGALIDGRACYDSIRGLNGANNP